MWTECAYLWTGLRTCAAPSANGSHTICYELKFVSFLCEHNLNGTCCVDKFVLCSPQVHGKLIYHALSTNWLVRMCVPPWVMVEDFTRTFHLPNSERHEFRIITAVLALLYIVYTYAWRTEPFQFRLCIHWERWYRELLYVTLSLQ